MSRLESFIRRLDAQRLCLDWAAGAVVERPGAVLELGLGNGRTYDHLRARLGAAFDYDTHVGGVYYLFLRGIRASDADGQGVFFTRPAKALIDGLDAMLGRCAP